MKKKSKLIIATIATVISLALLSSCAIDKPCPAYTYYDVTNVQAK